MKLDILAFAAHPDDVELGCGGTLLKHALKGKKVGIVDLTEGQLGTRGSVEQRYKEAADAAKILKLSVRENLQMQDGFFQNDPAHRLQVIGAIRAYQPEVILANAPSDRHPDHGRGAALVAEACFYAGLKAIVTKRGGEEQAPWRPKLLMHYIQDHYHKPDVIVDVSEVWEQRMDAVKAYTSQFYDPNNKEPNTPISGKEFLDFLDARAMEYGRRIDVKYGEGFVATTPLKITDLSALL